MAEPFLSELRLLSCVFAPRGWALCNGQLLPINQNQALFSLLGTTYGGDGRVNFALPDLRGRVPIHEGEGRTLGERGGEQAHTLSVAEMPRHAHQLAGTSAAATSAAPTASGTALQLGRSPDAYRSSADLAPLASASVPSIGGGQAHQNMQPYLTLTWCIALQGIFPSQS